MSVVVTCPELGWKSRGCGSHVLWVEVTCPELGWKSRAMGTVVRLGGHGILG